MITIDFNLLCYYAIYIYIYISYSYKYLCELYMDNIVVYL